jgi:hypothetical protein
LYELRRDGVLRGSEIRRGFGKQREVENFGGIGRGCNLGINAWHWDPTIFLIVPFIILGILLLII